MTAACFMLCSKETEGLVVGEKRTIPNGIASAGAESCLESGKWDVFVQPNHCFHAWLFHQVTGL